MKIRITQSGYQTFTGLLGDVKFEGGTSVNEVSDQQAAYVAAMFTVESFSEEVTPSGQNDAGTQAQSAELTSQGQEVADQDAAAKIAEAERLAAEAERERAEAEAAEAAAQAAAEEAAAAQVTKVAK